MVSDCSIFQFWGFQGCSNSACFIDTYSWIPGVFEGQGYADLFFQPDGANTLLVKKAAYDGCLEALNGAAESS